MGNTLHYFTNWLRGNTLFYMLLLGTVCAVQAQNTVTGVVSDSKGMTIPGVNVTIKGTATGVATNIDGQYSITAPEDAVLVYTFIGFTTQELAVKGRTKIDVTLDETAETLDEVVVIGYGTQRRQDINSSISTVKAKDLEDLPQVSIDQMLQGKAAGVSVTNNSGQPGGAVSIRVRGTTSLTGTNEPLYIIDGIPFSGDATNQSTSGRPIAGGDFTTQGSNAVSPLSMINPKDIESIDILKDASATAIYGSRGANGVIIITTKTGKKGTGKFTYDSSIAFSKQTRLLDVMNLQQYAKLQNALAGVYGTTPRQEFAHPELLGEGTDWQDEVFKTGILQNHQLSVSGGKEGIGYYLSGGYTDQEGTVIGSGFKRYTFKANLDAKAKDWLKVGGSFFGGITNEDLTLNSDYNGIISNALLQAPDLAVRNQDGSFAGAPTNDQSISIINPVALALSKTNELVRKNFYGNVFADINLVKGLTYRFEFGANTEFSENNEFTPSYVWGSSRNDDADLNVRRQNWYSWNLKNLLTYRLTLDKHDITLLAGQESNESVWSGLTAYGTGFVSNSIPTLSVADAERSTVSDYRGSQALTSYFGRFIYDYNSRYSISASIRADGSSKFDPVTKRQWGYFPGVSGSWKLSNEPFMEGTRKYIDNIKLKAGYGITGNQNIPGYRYGSVINAVGTGLGTGFLVGNMPRPDLQWERMEQTNLGLDFTLFNSRLGATVEVYKKTSDGFIYQLALPDFLTGGQGYEGGVAAPYVNLGSMENKGVDVTVTYNTKAGSDFMWNSTLIFSKYKNEVVDIRGGSIFREVNTNGFINAVVTSTAEGQPLGLFYGHEVVGIFNDAATVGSMPAQYGAPAELGDIQYRDTNGDNKVDADDRTIIGNPHPDFTYGFTNNFSYKGIDLSILLQGSQGNDVLNLSKRTGTTNTNLYTNQFAEAANFWTPDNTNTNIPRPVANASNNNLRISDRYIEDGSYLRIQNITIGYSLPTDVISKIKLTRLRLYAGVQNLYTFTKYSGFDPEVGSYNQDALLMGIDNGRYPTPKTYTMGLNVEF